MPPVTWHVVLLEITININYFIYLLNHDLTKSQCCYQHLTYYQLKQVIRVVYY